MLWFLPLLLLGCAQPAQLQVQRDPLPPALTAPCWRGPPIPEADTRLSVLLEVLAEREGAAALCAARHQELVRALEGTP